jgi:hypothetical protein
MEIKEVVLVSLLAKVGKYSEPEDHPTLSEQLAKELNLPLAVLLRSCQELAEDGFLVISPLSETPLLYLSLPGIARAKRLSDTFRLSV